MHAPGNRFSVLQALALAATLVLSIDSSLAAPPKRELNFNADWRFLREDVAGAELPDFDDGQWASVSCPHTWNDIDSFDDFGKGGHQGESDLWKGTAWYRKHFTLPSHAAGKKIIIEFQGVRQIADVYLNGRHLGRDATGFIPFGFDLTPWLDPSGKNILAVKVNNEVDKQYMGDQPWNHQNWHPPHGGIYRNVRLHILDPIHVTLPLHAHLGTEGIYAWTESLNKDQAKLGVSAEVQNSSDVPTSGEITFSLIDRDGGEVSSVSETIEIPATSKRKVVSSLQVSDPHLWEPAYPYVYQIRVTVSSGGTLRDVAHTPFGIRNFRFDRDTGFWINGRHVKLHGWGQKPGQEWAGLGTGIPDWMHDHTLKLMKDAGGNMLRWGHCAGPPVGAHSSDKYGFVTLMPGVDGERDCTGKAWATRTAAFRDLIIYYRNHPSICVWEGGNYNVSPQHAAEMRAIKEKWDPHGRRYFGFRMSTPGMLESLDIELGTVGRTRALPTLPVVETEYDRTETPRRVWDRFSPPDFGKLGKNAEQNTYNLDSEGFATNAISEWWTLFGSKPEHSGGANWIFSDGTHGTRQVTDVARATGEVDAVRLPKEAYWALQATWDEKPRVHLIGHWNYPEGTVKDMFAVAKADEVELFINGKSHGMGTRSLDTLFTWKNVAFTPGEIKVSARRNGKEIANQTKQTAGEAVALRLTPITAPGGWLADGSDIALIDFEVVDAEGRRCPTDQARVDFEVSGTAIWRGGYNSGKENSTNHLHLDTECGINRVSIRSTLTPGEIVITARREGLAPATLRLKTLPIALENGILEDPPRVLDASLADRPDVDSTALLKLAELRNAPPLPPVIAADSKTFFSTFAYTGNGAGGIEEPVTIGMLAYSDDAVLAITDIPERLRKASIIRTASKDQSYWANDYIVATARRNFELIIAHDAKSKKPSWLKDYEETGEKLLVNDRPMKLYSKILKTDENLRIPGNRDQGVVANSGLNLLLFCRPAS